MSDSLIRIKAVEARLGIKKSMLYDHIKKGLIVGAIRIGDRAVAFLSAEIDAIVAARIAGKSDDEIRDLVKTLMANRQKIADKILTAA
ncbi:MAG: AlpA family phage regulatory protein [Proteobacteria bacterium]|nr:AlpA family phage regulatory protein [Pseudomonadota bacterium]